MGRGQITRARAGRVWWATARNWGFFPRSVGSHVMPLSDTHLPRSGLTLSHTLSQSTMLMSLTHHSLLHTLFPLCGTPIILIYLANIYLSFKMPLRGHSFWKPPLPLPAPNLLQPRKTPPPSCFRSPQCSSLSLGVSQWIVNCEPLGVVPSCPLRRSQHCPHASKCSASVLNE